jgi:Uma2 family endonuclease
MSVAAARESLRMNVAEFLGFLRSRPDEERWELIGGIPMMMAPPTIWHQRIASNLERLLNDALRAQGSPWRADREIGLVLAASGYYRTEPEIAVVDADIDGKQSHASRFYLVAEVISPGDEAAYDDSGRRVIDVKLALYESHAHNRCVVLIRQDRVEVAMHVRRGDGTWADQPVLLTSLGDAIEISEIGRLGTVGDVYADTPLGAPRRPATS